MVILIGLFLFLNFSVWAVIFPLSTAADDDFHQPSIWCDGGNVEFVCHEVRINGDLIGVMVPQIIMEKCYLGTNPNIQLTPACLNQSSVEFHFTKGARGVDGRDISDGSSLNYGATFYTTMNLLIDDQPSNSVIRIRIFNAFLASVLFVVAMSVNSRPVKVALGVTWLLLMIPLGLQYVPSTNPISWSITGIGLLWAFVIGWVTTPKWNSWPAWVSLGGVIVTAFMAGSARRDGWLGVIISLIVCVVLLSSYRQASKVRWVVIIVGAVFIGLTYVPRAVNYVQGLLAGRIGNSGVSETIANPSGGSISVIREFLAFPKSLWAAIGGDLRGEQFSALALNDIGLPISVPVAITIGLLVMFSWSWRFHPKEKVFGVLLGALILMITIVGHRILISSEYAIQPRHIVPLAILIIGISLIAPSYQKISLFAIVTIGVSISIAVIGSLLTIHGRYTEESINGSISWSHETVLPPNLILSMGIVIALGWIITTLSLFRPSHDSHGNTILAVRDKSYRSFVTKSTNNGLELQPDLEILFRNG